jgi:hypothetical protein
MSIEIWMDAYDKSKPHLFVILTAIGWFIISIHSDLYWHRCLERQAFGIPRMYALSPSQNIKGSNYGEFLKDKNVLLCTRLYKYAPNLESLLTQQYAPFRVPKFLGEFNGKICSECISYNLEFQNFQRENPRTPRLPERGETPLSCSSSLAPAALGSCLCHSILPYFINWDSYFNSFWEPGLIIRSECTHYACILLCKPTFQIRSVLVQSCT